MGNPKSGKFVGAVREPPGVGKFVGVGPRAYPIRLGVLGELGGSIFFCLVAHHRKGFGREIGHLT